MNKFVSFFGTPGSLLWRISIALIGFGVVVTVALAIQAFSSQRLVEHEIWLDMLMAISSEHAAHIQKGESLFPTTGVIRSWYVTKDFKNNTNGTPVPNFLSDLPAGYYSSERMFLYSDETEIPAEESFHALIYNIPSGKLITVIDISEFESEQNRSSVISAMLGIFLVTLIVIAIFWLHLNLVRPVKDLANRMQALDPEDRSSRLPTNYAREEIQIIAHASNEHLDRVNQFVEREKSLLDQASHEFRTPISVIAGAVDILKKLSLPESSKPAISRIENAVSDLLETMQALLFLAREETAEMASSDVTILHEILPRLLEDHEHLLGSKLAELKLGHIEPTHIEAPEAIVRIAVSNLIRNAIENTDMGAIELSLTEGIITVSDSGKGFAPEEAARRYRESFKHSTPIRGQGLGLFLIGRICERFKWKLTIQPSKSEGTTVNLDISSRLIHI
ncbi:Signal transduction histidine-protein kinase ArlS [Thalassocella blandensis]|nr:Signal transduction histidine-protein kinase ArlS [Thalassocella blandensis]